MLLVSWRMGFLNRRLYIPSLKAWGFPANFGNILAFFRPDPSILESCLMTVDDRQDDNYAIFN
jgi:hypothetical protein